MEDNQFALITGTSSGLGFEMAEFLLEEGYTVIGVSRRGTPIDNPNFIDIIAILKTKPLLKRCTNSLAITLMNCT